MIYDVIQEVTRMLLLDFFFPSSSSSYVYHYYIIWLVSCRYQVVNKRVWLWMICHFFPLDTLWGFQFLPNFVCCYRLIHILSVVLFVKRSIAKQFLCWSSELCEILSKVKFGVALPPLSSCSLNTPKQLLWRLPCLV